MIGRIVPLLLASALGAGCGASSTPGGNAAPPGEAMPSTALDPPSYTPRPSSEAVALGPDGAVALSTTGGHERARQLAVALLIALRDGDEAGLGRLLSDPVAQIQPRLTAPTHARAGVLRRALRNPRRAGLGPSIALDELVDLDSAEVRPLAELVDPRHLPEGLSESDLLVSLRLHPRGRSYLRFLVPGWNLRATVLVRPDREPIVVGL